MRGLTFGQQDFVLQSMTGGRNEFIKDDQNVPSVMVRIGKFKVSDVIEGGPDTTHPMFIVDGVEKDSIWIGKYMANIANNGLPYSLPGVYPSNNISLREAVEITRAKGKGWHVMTNAEYAGLALLSRARGKLPRGNTYYGKSYDRRLEAGTFKVGSDKRDEAAKTYLGGSLYSIYNAVNFKSGKGNLYRCMGDKVWPMLPMDNQSQVVDVAVGLNQTGYALMSNHTILVFNKDNVIKTHHFDGDDTPCSIVIDRQNLLYVMSTSGKLYSVSGGIIERIGKIFDAKENDIVDMCITPTGMLWMSSLENGAIASYDPTTGTTKKYDNMVGVKKILYSPNNTLIALTKQKKIFVVSITNGVKLNEITLSSDATDVCINLKGTLYVSFENSRVLKKIAPSLEQSDITLTKGPAKVHSLHVTVDNMLQITGEDDPSVYFFEEDGAYYGKYQIGCPDIDDAISTIGSSGDPNGVIYQRTFQRKIDRYYTGQVIRVYPTVANLRFYTYNARRVRVTIHPDATLTKPNNRVSFELNTHHYEKLYTSISTDAIKVNVNKTEDDGIAVKVDATGTTINEKPWMQKLKKETISPDSGATRQIEIEIVELENNKGMLDSDGFYSIGSAKKIDVSLFSANTDEQIAHPGIKASFGHIGARRLKTISNPMSNWDVEMAPLHETFYTTNNIPRGVNNLHITYSPTTGYEAYVGGLNDSYAVSQIIRMTSTNGREWSSIPNAVNITIEPNLRVGELSAVRTGSGDYIGMVPGIDDTQQKLSKIFFVRSTDGLRWNSVGTPLSVGDLNLKNATLDAFTHDGTSTKVLVHGENDGKVVFYHISRTDAGFSKPIKIFSNANILNGAVVRSTYGYVGMLYMKSGSERYFALIESMDAINWSKPVKVFSGDIVKYPVTYIDITDVDITDENKIRVWAVVTRQSDSARRLVYFESDFDQRILTDNDSVLFSANRMRNVAQYIYGANNALIDHDMIFSNGSFAIPIAKNNGSYNKIQLLYGNLTTHKDYEVIEISEPGFDTVYPYSLGAPSIAKLGNTYHMAFHTTDKVGSGSAIYTIKTTNLKKWTGAPVRAFGPKSSTPYESHAGKAALCVHQGKLHMFFIGIKQTATICVSTYDAEANKWNEPTGLISLTNVDKAKFNTNDVFLAAYSDGTDIRLVYGMGDKKIITISSDSASTLALKTPVNVAFTTNEFMTENGIQNIRICDTPDGALVSYIGIGADNIRRILYRHYTDDETLFRDCVANPIIMGDRYHQSKVLENTSALGSPTSVSVLRKNHIYETWASFIGNDSSTTTMYRKVGSSPFQKCFSNSSESGGLFQDTFFSHSVLNTDNGYLMYVLTKSKDGAGSTTFHRIELVDTAGVISWPAKEEISSIPRRSYISAKVMYHLGVYYAVLTTDASIFVYTSTDGKLWVEKSSILENRAVVNALVYTGSGIAAYVRTGSKEVVIYRSDLSASKWVKDLNSVCEFTIKNSYGVRKDPVQFDVSHDTYKYIATSIVSESATSGSISQIYSEDGIIFGYDSKEEVILDKYWGYVDPNAGFETKIDYTVTENNIDYSFDVGDRFRIDYTGNVEATNVCNITKMRIRAYGASGADTGAKEYLGGKGGYAYGDLNTSHIKCLTFAVGSVGGYNASKYGFNGGGRIIDQNGRTYHGGGATDIRTAYNDLYRRLIVAGGGGSADESDGTIMSGHNGGNAGGLIGASGAGEHGAGGGTQREGGATSLTNMIGWDSAIFGYGSVNRVITTDKATMYGAGGGGLYGGGNSYQGGGGGSSYVSGHSDAKYINPDGIILSNTGIADAVHIGNGYVTCSVLSATDIDDIPRTENGSGPVAWNIFHETSGVSDLVGNLNEMVTGMMLVNGRFQFIPNNDAAGNIDVSPESSAWCVVHNDKYYRTDTAVALNYTDNISAIKFSELLLKNDCMLAKVLAVSPVDDKNSTGYVNAIMNGTFIPLRGGYYGSYDTNGIFNLSMITDYNESSAYSGFRIAYYD